MLTLALVAALAMQAPATAGAESVGRSAEGRPIEAVRVGSPRARTRVLVFGVIHGSEQAGRQVTRLLRNVRAPRGVELWIVDDLNPDGTAAGTRQNANGVDLNRNFPYRWRAQGEPGSTYHSGSGPLSEPEAQVARDLIERIRPRITIWYHQALRMVVRSPGDAKLQRRVKSRWRAVDRSHGRVKAGAGADATLAARRPGRYRMVLRLGKASQVTSRTFRLRRC